MPLTTNYVFIVSMDVAAEKEALFNEVYDSEHVPNLLKVPGVRAVTRLRSEPASFSIAGRIEPLSDKGSAKYMAIYEIDSPDILTSAAWAEASEMGRWPTEVRPHTSNRQHIVRKIVSGSGK